MSNKPRVTKEELDEIPLEELEAAAEIYNRALKERRRTTRIQAFLAGVQSLNPQSRARLVTVRYGTPFAAADGSKLPMLKVSDCGTPQIVDLASGSVLRRFSTVSLGHAVDHDVVVLTWGQVDTLLQLWDSELAESHEHWRQS